LTTNTNVPDDRLNNTFNLFGRSIQDYTNTTEKVTVHVNQDEPMGYEWGIFRL